MPSSVIQGKAEIKEWVYAHEDIKTILDVGCGQGTYAKLLGKKYKYIGVDIWMPYKQMWDLEKLYEQVVIGDIYWMDMTLFSSYDVDCIIFGDVLEHLPKAKALAVLDLAIDIFPHVVVSVPLSDTPGEIRPGKVHYDNPFEAHQSSWVKDEMDTLYKWDRVVHAGKNNVGVYMK